MFFCYAQEETYDRHMSYLNSYVSKIKSKEQHLKQIIERKNSQKDPLAVQASIDEMVMVSRELIDLREKYNEVLNTVKYKYPDKGKETNTKYQRAEEKSISDYEMELNLDSRLSEAKKKAQEKINMPKEGVVSIKTEEKVEQKKLIKSRKQRSEEEEERVLMSQ